MCVHSNHTGPTDTFISLWSNSGTTFQAPISQTCWYHLLKQPSVWCVKTTKHIFFCFAYMLVNVTIQRFLSLFYLRAVIIAHLCHSSTHFTLLSWLPTFFKETYPHSKVTKSLRPFFVGNCVFFIRNDFKLLFSWYHYVMLIGVNTGLGV